MRKDEVGGMLNTEYVRNLNCNYERILLDKKPEEKRYQYCILNRGGIKGLLPCSLRYINGVAYLYYDISSKQNVTQLYGNKCVSREWVVDLLWNIRQIRQELERFLLDSRNIIWRPEQIFQDLESNVFSFLYVPYYEGDSGYLKLMEFLIDHIDYEDTVLVECVYSMYEQLERNGEVYLQAQIYEDAKRLEGQEAEEAQEWDLAERETAGMQIQEVESRGVFATEDPGRVKATKRETAVEDLGRVKMLRRETATEEPGRVKTTKRETAVEDPGRVKALRRETAVEDPGRVKATRREMVTEEFERENMLRKENVAEEPNRGEKRSIRSIFEGKKKRGRELREDFRQAMQQEMEGYAVAEETTYEETTYEEEPYGRTVFIEEKVEDAVRPHRLLTSDGRLLATWDKPVFSIGKKRDDADLVLENPSVSRIHARIVQEKTDVYLEDLNSTNGTYKNGLRMQPYEKRKLDEGDEIKCGTVILIFR